MQTILSVSPGFLNGWIRHGQSRKKKVLRTRPLRELPLCFFRQRCQAGRTEAPETRPVSPVHERSGQVRHDVDVVLPAAADGGRGFGSRRGVANIGLGGRRRQQGRSSGQGARVRGCDPRHRERPKLEGQDQVRVSKLDRDKVGKENRVPSRVSRIRLGALEKKLSQRRLQ